MSITDELRGYARGYETMVNHKLLAIADRIDAEHERKVAEVASGWDYWESTHVELPKDADGEYIHVGDMMVADTGARDEVRFLTLNGAGWMVNENGWLPDYLRHYHAPTVEDVLREFADRVCNSGHQWGLDADDTIAEYAPKLRLAVDE